MRKKNENKLCLRRGSQKEKKRKKKLLKILREINKYGKAATVLLLTLFFSLNRKIDPIFFFLNFEDSSSIWKISCKNFHRGSCLYFLSKKLCRTGGFQAPLSNLDKCQVSHDLKWCMSLDLERNYIRIWSWCDFKSYIFLMISFMRFVQWEI